MINEDDRRDWPLAVGVDAGGTQIRVAVLRGDKLLSRVHLLTGKATTPDRMIPRIYRAIEQAVDEAAVQLEQIAGIGIGVPGPVNSQTGIVFTLPNLSEWSNVPLRDIFVEHYGLPSVVENDGNAAALGEYLFGAGRNCRNEVYLTIGTGIGGGVIVNGQLLRGASGAAAELGHMTIDWHGMPCVCGNIGCLESIASGTAIARRANEAIAQGLGGELLPWAALNSIDDETAHEDELISESGQPFFINVQGVARAAAHGVSLAYDIINDAAIALGIGLVNIIHLFNPEIIVLGGGVTQIGPMLMKPILRVVQERAMGFPYKDVRIVSAQMGADAGIIGAGALNFFSDNTDVNCCQ
jgi:glucokinase